MTRNAARRSPKRCATSASRNRRQTRKCIKDNLTGDATSCVDAVSVKAADKEASVYALFDLGGDCNPNAAFGVVDSGTPAGDDAAKAIESGTDDILRDLWGNPVDGIVEGNRCGDSVAKRTGKLYDAIIKSFVKCIKSTPPADLAALDTCIGLAVTGGPSVKASDKLVNEVGVRCGIGGTETIGVDDGVCDPTGGEPFPFTICARDLTQCRACLALTAVTGGSPDCDFLDDEMTNSSCN